MKKRSKYRPKPQLPDPLGWVLGGLQPLTTAVDEVTRLRAMNHGAIRAVVRGQATIDDADTLLGAFNMAEALGKLGVGTDWLPEIAQAQEALRSAGQRPRFGFSGPEIEVVNTAMVVHDLQLAHHNTTVALVDKALKMVRRDLRLKRTKPLFFTQGANP